MLKETGKSVGDNASSPDKSASKLQFEKRGLHIDRTEYIRKIIRDYPTGVGLIKELVQNADDAGATIVRFTVDHRSFVDLPMPDERMKSLLGPALLVYNNSQFDEKDFEGITQLAVGGKRDDPSKTGRFGLGFNTVYNITEVPQFISGDQLTFFDPQAKYVYGSTKSDPVISFRLVNAIRDFPGLLEPFESAGLIPCMESLDGTVFRFPLRTASQAISSDLSKGESSISEIGNIVASVAPMATSLLLFLRNVMELEFWEIGPKDMAPTLISRYATLCSEEVLDARRRLQEFRTDKEFLTQLGHEKKRELSFRQVITAEEAGESRQEEWAVNAGFYAGASNELLDAARDLLNDGEKASPEAAVAAQVSSRDSRFSGKLFCFLPFPQPTTTGLPVHVHAFFDPDSSRQGATTGDDLQGEAGRRAKWNTLLVEHAVAPCYKKLLALFREEFGVSNTAKYYSYLPGDTSSHPVLADLTLHVYSEADDSPLFLTCAADNWQLPQDTLLVPAVWAGIQEPLALAGLSVPAERIPEHVIDELEKLELAPPEVTSDEVRKLLLTDSDINCNIEEAPQLWLTRTEWVQDLLRFCLSHAIPRDESRLLGLPLALTINGRLRTFGRTLDSEGQFTTLLIAPDEPTAKILEPVAEWVLDTTLVMSIGANKLACSLTEIVTPELMVTELLPSIIGEEPVAWTPTAATPPNEDWLSTVFRYLRNRDSDLEPLKDKVASLPILPSSSGFLFSMKNPSAPVTRSDQSKAFSSIGVEYIEGSKALISDINTFRASYNSLFPRLSAETIATRLTGFVDAELVSDAVINEVLGFLHKDRQLLEINNSPLLKETLRSLSIHRTTSGGRAALTDRTFLAGMNDRTLPQLGELTLLEPASEHVSLYSALGAQQLDSDAALRLVLSEYPAMSDLEKLNALTWVRATFDRLQLRLPGEATNQRAISEAPLVKCTDGIYRAMSEIYDPKATLPRRVLGARAYTPEMRTYSSGAEQWIGFFAEFGMSRSPRDSDIAQYVEVLAERGEESGVNSVRREIQELWNFLRERVQDPTKPLTSELQKVLKTVAWLPASIEQAFDTTSGQGVEDRLYLPEEVYPAPRRGIVGSRAPALPFTDSLLLRQRIGMPDAPPISIVIEAFKDLIADFESTDSKSRPRKEIRQSFDEFYRFFGQNEFAGSAELADFQNIKCIWDESSQALWRPIHVFRESVAHLEPWRKRIHSQEALLDRGYEALGRVDEPDSDHLVDVLDDIRLSYKETALGEADSIVVLRVYQHLIELEHADNIGKLSIPLLSSSNTLVEPENSYLSDAPWFKERIDPGAVNLVHRSVNPEFAMKLGARRLSTGVHESLTGKPSPSLKEHDTGVATRFERVVCSNAFRLALVRLSKHEALDDWDLQALDPSQLTWLSSLQITAAEEIWTQHFLVEGDVLVGAGPAQAHIDREASIAYLQGPPVAKHLADLINRSLGDQRLHDVSPVLELLGTEPAEFGSLLDRLRIADLDYEEPGWPEDLEDRVSSDRIERRGGDAVEAGSNLNDVHRATTTTGEPKEADSYTAASRGPSQSRDDTGSDERTSAKVLLEGDHQGLGGTDSGETDSAGRPPGGPSSSFIQTHVGPERGNGIQSELASSRRTNASASPNNTSNSQARHRTVVYTHKVGCESVEESEDDGRALKTGEAAVELVLQYETKNQRKPQAQRHENPGFDVFSTAGDHVRYIEVKGLLDGWRERGVLLSRRQFFDGLERGDSFWLYVVEHALDESKARLHCLQNPTAEIDYFAFDAGWSELLADPVDALKVGARIQDEAGKMSEVISIKQMGQIAKVRLRDGKGEEVSRTFDPSKMRIVSE